jgi:xanthine dehydrogenase accessory factor
MSVPSTRLRPVALREAGAWLTPLAGHWIDAARDHLSRHTALARITVIAVRGSTPREAGATMLVDAAGTVGTIGGGELEWRATALARELLRDSRAAPARIVHLILGRELGQCCGGRVELWLERLTRKNLPWLDDAARRLRVERGLAVASEMADGIVSHRLLRHPVAGTVVIEGRAPERVTLFEMPQPHRPDVWIFGAGHVGQALVRLLAELALFEITWIDSRAGLLPACVPSGVTSTACAAPANHVAAAPAGTRFVVMTHDHALDYEICRMILARTDSCWVGLIGSASKSARFRSRLLRDGLSRETVSRLNCPIGVAGISSKLPGAIAIAIAAQLLQQAKPKLPHSAASDAASDAPSYASSETSETSETLEAPEAAPGASSGARAEPDPSGCAGDCRTCATARRKKK